MTEKLYARRDTESLCEIYMKHVDAMTREGLHDKSKIAAELAFRDNEIRRLATLVTEHESQASLQEMRIKDLRDAVLEEAAEKIEQFIPLDPNRTWREKMHAAREEESLRQAAAAIRAMKGNKP